jgi:hypothetical protein
VIESSRPAGVSSNLTAFNSAYASSFGSAGIAEYVETLPAAEARWYRYLGERSDAETAAWPSRGLLTGYLEAVGRIRLRSFAMLAFAYLHLAYDFPRFLADSFPLFPDVAREQRYRVYIGGTSLVRKAMVRESRRSVVGIVTAMSSLLPRERPLAVGWMLAHRCAAWTAAEALAAAADRATLEAKLWKAIDEAARVLLRRPPWRWMRELPYSADLVPTRG